MSDVALQRPGARDGDGDVRASARPAADPRIHGVCDPGPGRAVRGLAGDDELDVTGVELVVLDRQQTALVGVEVAEAELGAALRAGEGATQMTPDSFEQVLVTDTTGGELLIYSTGPVLLHQGSPLSGAPYAVAVDPSTGVVSVASASASASASAAAAGAQVIEPDAPVSPPPGGTP